MSTPTRAALLNASTGAPIFPTTRYWTLSAANDAGVAGLDPDAICQLAIAEDTGKLFQSDGTSIGDWVSAFTFNRVTCAQFLTTGGERTAIAAKTTTYTVTVNDHTLLGDATSASFDMDLPAAATCAGQIFVFKKTDASGNTVNIDPNGSEVIEGGGAGTSYNLTLQYEAVTIQSDGAKWWIIGYDQAP